MDPGRIKILSAKDFDDYEFILNDLLRFAQMKPGDLKAHYQNHPEDRLRFIPRPGGGNLLLSKKADDAFWNIAERGCGVLGSGGRTYYLPDVVKGLKRELLKRYTEAPESINDENAHELFQTVIGSLQTSHKNFEHFIPCSVVTWKRPSEFNVGPVRFVSMQVFLEKDGGRLLAEIPENLKNFFLDFKWMAKVKIPAASKTVSTMKAQVVAGNALNLLKLFIGAEYSNGVRDAYSVGKPHQNVNIAHDGLKFHVSSGWKVQGAVVAEGWFDFLSSLDGWKIGEQILSAHAGTWDRLSEAEQRFLDALAWYGDAVSDSDLRTQILKFWICIERVVSTDITCRAATLASYQRKTVDAARNIVSRLYGVRSGIVHGRRSRPNESLGQDAWQTGTLASTILIHYLYVVRNLSLIGKTSRTDIEEELCRLATLAKRED